LRFEKLSDGDLLLREEKKYFCLCLTVLFEKVQKKISFSKKVIKKCYQKNVNQKNVNKKNVLKKNVIKKCVTI